jgi:uncharacterized protein YdeI (YjbR/CyaY-like superfamily)
MGPDTRSEEDLQPRDRREWRKWLEQNHASSRGVWLIYYKKNSGKTNLSLDEALMEAVSYGWIDGRMHRLDDERVRLWFTPRRKGSLWSRSNKLRVERAIEDGLMTPAGMAKVEEAQRNGSWNILEDVEDLLVPDDLAEALGDRPQARERFDALSGSKRKQLLAWIKLAKRPQTRADRIGETVRFCQGEKIWKDLGR